MASIKVKGMSCQHCKNAVTEALNGVKGLSNVQVNLEKGEASFDMARPENLEQAKQAVREAGYQTE